MEVIHTVGFWADTFCILIFKATVVVEHIQWSRDWYQQQSYSEEQEGIPKIQKGADKTSISVSDKVKPAVLS